MKNFDDLKKEGKSLDYREGYIDGYRQRVIEEQKEIQEKINKLEHLNED